jgi:Leucine-rich repeat (LRR) protein
MRKIWISFCLIASAFAVLFAADVAKSPVLSAKTTSGLRKVVAAPGTYSADSIIVKRIFDSIGCSTCEVSSLTDSANGRITSLYLSNMGLTKVPEAIGNLNALTYLSLALNKLTTLPSQIGNLSALIDLDLSNNNLSMLPTQIGNLSLLNTLNLSHNAFSSLPAEIGNFGYLNQLDLSNNSLTSLPTQIGNLNALNLLDLSNNNLTSLPTQFGNLSVLTQLILLNNKLTSLPAQFGNLNALTQLDLSNNSLTSLPVQFGNLSVLTQLNLSNNKLVSLPAQIGNLSALTNLDLSNNSLTILPGEIGNLKNLVSLSVNNNNLNSLPAGIIGLSELTTISVLYNNLCDISDPIKSWLTSKDDYWQHWQICYFAQDSLILKEILKANKINISLNSLVSNSLVSLDSIGRITKLTLDSKGITIIPDTIRALSALTNLSVANNALSELPVSVTQIARLQYLNLNNNKLTTLPGNITYLKFPPDTTVRIWIHPTCGPYCIPQIDTIITNRLALKGNQLCNLPDSIKNWVMEYAPGDLQSQACNSGLRTALKMRSSSPLEIRQTPNGLLITGALSVADLELQVITANGRFIRSEKLHARAGKLSYIIPRSFLARGMNIIQLTGPNCRYLLHTIVQ